MCGICGAVQIEGEPRRVLEPGVLNRMTDAMTHRGPNDRGTYVADGVALGVRRLSVVDVEGGHQPFSDEREEIWAVQNGELYNHAELRRGLADDGHVFRSRCDTEVIPHLYERHGVSFMEHLRGMFGLAVWDGRRRRAVIARDRLGIKPLYYARSGDLLLFASELKSLLASGLVSVDLDYEAIDAYLSLGFVPGPRTPLAAVSKLSPGHRLVVADGGVTSEPFWSFPQPNLERADRSLDDYAERLLAELDHSVQLRLMSDVPLGAMLSGGLDSSLIVALMARQMNRPVQTFSVGFVEAGPANELSIARRVASELGADHHELELSFADQTVDLPELVWHLDEPLADLSALGFLALSELAAGHVTVALSGQGADELLGGYSRHRTAAMAEDWQRLPRAVRAAGRAAAVAMPERVRNRLRTLDAPDATSRFLSMKQLAPPELRRGLAVGPLADLDGNAPARAIQGRLDGLAGSPLATTLHVDARLGLVDDMLHYFDRTSMAHSLEVRVPFLDHELVEYCATIPSEYKASRGATKIVLKRAARGLVPDDIIDRPKVGFFNASVASWMRAQAGGSVSEFLFGSNPRYGEMLDRHAVERLARGGNRPPTRREQNLLLSILMLEIWLSSFLPRALAASTAPTERVEVGA